MDLQEHRQRARHQKNIREVVPQKSCLRLNPPTIEQVKKAAANKPAVPKIAETIHGCFLVFSSSRQQVHLSFLPCATRDRKNDPQSKKAARMRRCFIQPGAVYIMAVAPPAELPRDLQDRCRTTPPRRLLQERRQAHPQSVRIRHIPPIVGRSCKTQTARQ